MIYPWSRKLLPLLLLYPTLAWGDDCSQAIPEDTWVQCDAPFVDDRDQSQDGSEPDYRAFSSMEATDDGRLIYWGGGHQNYGGNDVDVYETGTDEWRQWTEEENWKTDLCDGTYGDAGGSDPPCWHHLSSAEKDEFSNSIEGGTTRTGYLSGRGRPITRHVYQQMDWWPEKGWFIVDYKGDGLWAWDPSRGDDNGAWMQITPDNDPASGGQGGIAQWSVRWDSVRKQWVSFQGGSGSYQRVEVLENGAWSGTGISVSNDGGQLEVYAEHDIDDDLWVVNNDGDWQVIDLGAGTSTNVADTNASQCFEYDPISGDMIVLDEDAGDVAIVRSYDAATDTWATLSVANAPDLTGAQNSRCRWDVFEYDPVRGRFYMLYLNGETGGDADLWTFKLHSGAGTPNADPSPLPRHSWVSKPTVSSGEPNGSGKDFKWAYRDTNGLLYMTAFDGNYDTGEPADRSQNRGNDTLFSYDVETNDWTVVEPMCSDAPHLEVPDELGFAYDSTRDDLWLFPGFQHPSIDCAPESSELRGETVRWDFDSQGASPGWEVTGHGTIWDFEDVNFVEYDAVSDRFYGLKRDGGDGTHVREIDPTSSTPGSVVIHGLSDAKDSEKYTPILDEAGRALYFVSAPSGDIGDGGNWVRFDLDDKTETTLGAIPAGIAQSNEWGAWDPNTRTFLVPQGDDNDNVGEFSSEVYQYHPDIDAWTSFTFPTDGGLDVFGNSAAFDEDSQTLVWMGCKGCGFDEVFALEFEPPTARAMPAHADAPGWDGTAADGNTEILSSSQAGTTTSQPLDVGEDTPDGGTITVTISAPVDVDVTQNDRALNVDAPMGWGVRIEDTDDPGTWLEQSAGPDYGAQLVDVTVDDPPGQDASYELLPGRARIYAPQNVALEVQ